MKKNTVLISCSGGLDSTVAICLLKERGFNVEGVSFNYGSKHNSLENKAAKKICNELGVPLYEINIEGVTKLFESSLLLSGGTIPEGHYEDSNMKKTVVPSRNLIFLSILAGIAESKEIPFLAIGVHQGDHFIYPDCRPEFINALRHTIMLSSDFKILDIIAPLLSLNKIDIVKEGIRLKAPFHLTRTCYTSNEKACGKCGSCNERLEAFSRNNLIDPIDYE